MATATVKPWWLCPNEPRCPHAALFHDVYDAEDTMPRCCAEGCECGKPQMTAMAEADGDDWYCTCPDADGPHVHCMMMHIHLVDIETGRSLT